MIELILKSKLPNLYKLTCNLIKSDPSIARVDIPVEIYLTPEQEYIFVTPTAVAIADSIQAIQDALL